jgi:hypothetical protein
VFALLSLAASSQEGRKGRKVDPDAAAEAQKGARAFMLAL